MKKNNNLLKFIEKRSFIGNHVRERIYTEYLKILGLHSSTLDHLVAFRKRKAVIEINCTINGLIRAFFLIRSIIKANGHIFIINTNEKNNHFVTDFAEKIKNYKKNFSFCTIKWVGGTLTNWRLIMKSVGFFFFVAQRYKKFIRRNDLYIPLYRKRKRDFQGFFFLDRSIKKNLVNQRISNIKEPSLVIIINPKQNYEAINEARVSDIPVIALTDTNTNLSFIGYPIPVNNISPVFIEFFFSWILRLLKFKKVFVKKNI